MERFHYEQIDSTNEQAKRLAASHSGEILLVTADAQTAGRGRFGRTWQSPRGGAWMSLVWPTSLPPERYTAAPLVAALATWRTIRHAFDQVPSELLDSLEIKWPNDILLAGRKVAGILCQRVLPADTADSDVGSLIIGVGINVDFPLGELPDDLRWPATTLAEAAGFAIYVDPIIVRFAETAATMMATFERDGLTKPMLDELGANLAFVGQVVTLSIADRKLTGTIGGLDDQGRLLLATEDGVVACESGEVKDVQT